MDESNGIKIHDFEKALDIRKEHSMHAGKTNEYFRQNGSQIEIEPKMLSSEVERELKALRLK